MSTNRDEKTARTPNEKILAVARKRFPLCVKAEEKLRLKQLEDKKFAAGEQWDPKVKADRAADSRPCLTIDRLTPQLKQITNQQKSLRPASQVTPRSDGARVETAQVFQGIIRNIETNSDADDAYDQAGRDQVEIGIGWWKIITQYCDDDSGNQDLRIERIRNPFKVYHDPAAMRRDRADMKYAFEVSDLEEVEFEELYPKAVHTTADEFFSSLGDEAPNWIDGGRIRVVKYWHVETTRSTVKLANGKTREKESRKVRCHILTGLEVLKEYEWAGKYIPLVPVLGDEREIEGEVDLRGVVRNAKDPQRMFNYWRSATTETMALAPKSPYVVAEGQLEGREQQWRESNVRNRPFLTYKPRTFGGELAPPPQRQVVEPPIQAMMASTQAAENDLRAVTGFFDVGEQESREQSGKAITARMQMGQHGNSDYLDGLARAIRHSGRILVDLIPKIYDVPRVLKILGTDNKPQNVMVHAGQDNAPAAPGVDPQTGQPMAPQLPPGVAGIYDLNAGEYDVTVSQGPSLESSRQEFLQNIAPILQSQPQLFMMIGDLIFEEMDVPNAKVLAERIKIMQDPRLHGGQQMPPQAQAALGQLQGQLQLLQQKLAEAEQTINSKQIETASKEKIAGAELESKERLAGVQADLERFKAQQTVALAAIKAGQTVDLEKLSASHAGAQQALEHQHAREMAEQAAARAAMAQEQGGAEPKAA